MNNEALSRGTAIVTGAAEGIGRAIAIRLAEDGYDIGLFDLPRSEQKLQAVAEHIQKETGRRTVNVLGDVSVEDDVKALVENVVRDLGGLDVMIANAGIAVLRPLHETSMEDFERMNAVNVRGTFLSYKYAAMQMIKQGRGGRILGASSIAGKKGFPDHSIYCSTKFAVRGMTQCAAMDYGKYGITVNAYAPGAVETSLLAGVDAWQSQKMGQPPGTWAKSLNDANVLGRNGQPNDVVGVVSFLVSKDASFITGQTITVDGGSVYD